MAIQKITADVISSDAITTASISDSAITAAKLAGTLDLTGKTITIATASSGDNDTSPASTAFVQQEISALVDSSPDALNTLNELAAALGDDANFSTTVTNSIALKAPLASPDFTGDATFDTTTLVVDATNNRVGIGTSSPAKTLHLAAGSSVIRLEDTDGGYGEVSGSNGNIRLRADEGNTQASSFMSFDIDSTEEMRLTTTGLGIGTTSPSAGLHIETDVNPVLRLDRGSANNTNANLYYNGTFTGQLSAANAEFQISAVGSSTPTTFFTNGSERMRINATGGLSINDDVENGLNLNRTTTTTGASYMKFTNGGGNYYLGADSSAGDRMAIGGLAYGFTMTAESGRPIVFATSNTARMTLDSSGSVGIGTTSPLRTLHVNSGSTNVVVRLQSTDGIAAIEFKDSTGSAEVGCNGNDVVFFPAGAEKARLTSGGNFGIGTLSSSATENLIHAKGTNNSAGDLGTAVGPGNIPAIHIQNAGTTDNNMAAIFFMDDASVRAGVHARFTSHSSDDAELRLSTSAGGNLRERMVIDKDGNVGIGEASPDKILHLKSSGATGIVIESTTNAQNLDIDFYNNAGSAQGRIRYAEGAGSFGFAPNVSASDALHILYNGNVGIGTDSPTQKLEVSPDSDIQAIIGRARIGDLGYDDFAGFGHYDTGVQYAILQHNTGQTFINASSGYPINFRINNATKMIINSNGRVGIGTTTTNAGLTVANGDIRATGAAFANDANSISMSQESSGGVITARGPSTATRGSITLSVNKSNGGDAIAGLKIENDGGLFAFGIAYASASSDVNYNASTGEIFVVSSSRRYKSNITDLNIDTSKILSLRPVSYTDNETETNAVGLIAEEVHEEIPQLVNYKEIEGYDEIQPDSVKYSTLSVYLLKVIKEQQTTIDDLKSRIETLEG